MEDSGVGSGGCIVHFGVRHNTHCDSIPMLMLLHVPDLNRNFNFLSEVGLNGEEKQTSVTRETGTLDARIVRPVFVTTWTQVLHKM